MNPFSESNLVASTAINLIKKLWNDDACHINIYSNIEDMRLERDHRGEVVFKKFFQPMFEKFNPSTQKETLDQALN